MRIGILGGTFDPIHIGHIQPAQQVFKEFSLDKLLVIPAHKPPHKNTTNTTTEHRVNMVEIVCENEADFVLDKREIQRTTLSYTIDTIKEIKDEYPNSDLYFIMGMDSLLDFTTWFQWQDILACCNLIVNTRPGFDLSTVNADTQTLLNNHQIDKNNNKSKKTVGNIYLNQSENLNISSTKIRKNISNNISCQAWLPLPILEYIKLHQLYR